MTDIDERETVSTRPTLRRPRAHGIVGTRVCAARTAATRDERCPDVIHRRRKRGAFRAASASYGGADTADVVLTESVASKLEIS